MKYLLFIAAIFTLCNLLHAALPSGNDIYTKLTSPPGKESLAALDIVLKNADIYQTADLYMASAVCIREQRLEDAAFLFYVARLRLRFDQSLFPPVGGTGGDDPTEAYAAIHLQLGQSVNPAIMAHPRLFANALARVKTWDPKAAEDYNPGWSFSKRGINIEAMAALAEARKQFSKAMDGLCTLLQDDAYFSAFKICQAYNLKSGAERPSQKAYDASLQTLKRIEKEKGINGFGAMTDR